MGRSREPNAPNLKKHPAFTRQSWWLFGQFSLFLTERGPRTRGRFSCSRCATAPLEIWARYEPRSWRSRGPRRRRERRGRRRRWKSVDRLLLLVHCWKEKEEEEEEEEPSSRFLFLTLHVRIRQCAQCLRLRSSPSPGAVVGLSRSHCCATTGVYGRNAIGGRSCRSSPRSSTFLR